MTGNFFRVSLFLATVFYRETRCHSPGNTPELFGDPIVRRRVEQYAQSKMREGLEFDPEKEVKAVVDILKELKVSSNVTLGLLPPVGAEFSCPALEPSPEVPQSVHKLRPSDIKVIGALGDSISAAFVSRAGSLLEFFLLREYVGNSWSIGGDSGDPTETSTLANFLQFYNKELTGFSTGSCIGTTSGSNSCPNGNLNMGVSAAKARGMLSQAGRLVEMMRSSQEINVEEDWKVVTLWIGGNDLCQHCRSLLGGATPEEYVQQIQDSLDYLQENLPRTFVNLVNILNVTLLKSVSSGFQCQLFYSIECPCVDSLDSMDEYVLGYQNGLQALASSDRYSVKDDFTVVLQPFYEELKLPENPIDYFSPDCFHFNTLGQAVAGVSLWNNMLEPVGSKSKEMFYDLVAKCPQEPYYFFTKENSLPFSP